MGGGTASAAAADSANTSGAAGVGSPVSASHAGSATPLSPAAGAATSRSAVSVSSSAGGSVVGAGATATPRTPSSSSVGDTSAAQLGSGLGATSSSSAAAAALLSAAASDEACLRELRAEKKRLQLFLRDYERAFEQREGRKVRGQLGGGCVCVLSARCGPRVAAMSAAQSRRAKHDLSHLMRPR